MERLRIGRVGKGQKVKRKTRRNHRNREIRIEHQDLRVCERHVTDWTIPKSVTYLVPDGSEMKQKSTTIPPFKVPVSAGSMKSKPSTISNGVGNDRELLKHVVRESANDAMLSPSARHAVARERKISSHEEFNKSGNDARETKLKTEVQQKEMSVVHMEDMEPMEVKERTGFDSIVDLLQYSAITYGGDLDAMTQTHTKLDWLEELLLFYEFSYHHAGTRLRDYVKPYKVYKRTAKAAIIYRLEKELKCRERWPMYCSLEEDIKFRQEKWNHVGNKRVVFHDTTNKPMHTPSQGHLQRALYNKYYGGCVGKAGVAAQLCNWVYGLPLVTGHSDDDQQIDQTKILEYQKDFAEKDLVDGEVIPFFNVYDKGYNKHLDAKKLGQECVTPTSSGLVQTSDNAVLRSAGVAVFRSGNERAVRRSKLSLFIANKPHHAWNVDFVCDIWEAWTFRLNFMYQDYQ